MNNNKSKTRKRNRLENYDYSSSGAYFITICTNDRRNYFWDDVGATIGRPLPTNDYNNDNFIYHPQDVKLSEYGKIVDDAINNIPEIYPTISVDFYVIMPDHIHLILFIKTDEFGRPMVAPTISRVIQQMKGYVTKNIGVSIWQKLFHDHIIRNQHDYDQIVKYIYENPIRWNYDEIFSDKSH